MDPQIVFEDIESPDQRQKMKDMLDEIVQLSPSDAAVRATFRFFQDHFLAEIKIASESAYMTAVDQAGALGDLMEHLKSKLMGQIVDWRIHRFAS